MPAFLRDSESVQQKPAQPLFEAKGVTEREKIKSIMRAAIHEHRQKK